MQLKVPETRSLDHADISRYLVFLLTLPEQKVTVAQTQLVSPKKGESDFSENPLFFTLGICLRQVKGKIGKSTSEKSKNQHNFWSSSSYTFIFGGDGTHLICFWKKIKIFMSNFFLIKKSQISKKTFSKISDFKILKF